MHQRAKVTLRLQVDFPAKLIALPSWDASKLSPPQERLKIRNAFPFRVR
jgi:hypothetical protein